MTDHIIDQRIRERFATADGPSDEAHDALVAIHDRIEQHHRGRRRRRIGIAVGAALVAVGVVVAARTGNGSGNDGARVATTPTVVMSGPRPVVTEADGVQALPAPPLQTRTQSAIVWTGNELVVWGGSIERNAGLGLPERAHRDGAAYDPSTGKWRKLARSPLPGSTDTPVAVMTRQGVVIVQGNETALWNPTTNKWRAMQDVPGWCAQTCWRSDAVRDLTVVGDALLSYSANATLDLGSGRWSELPEPPRHFERFAVASTGKELVVIGGDSALVRNTGAFAFTPGARAWRQLPAPPALSQQAIAADWDGERVIAIDYEMHAAAYDPDTGAWSTLPEIPARFAEFTPSLRSATGESLATTAQALAVLTEDNNWVAAAYGEVPAFARLEAPPISAPSNGPRTVLAVGIDEQRRMKVVAIDLDKLAATPYSPVGTS